MTTYTKEEKDAYFKKLRARWEESKKLSATDESAKAVYRESGGNISYISFWMTLQDMEAHGFDGLPYIDCKTFKGWRSSGFKVRKGEKCLIHGITWVGAKDDDGEEDEDSFRYPKVYNLFHRSQVDPLKSAT